MLLICSLGLDACKSKEELVTHDVVRNDTIAWLRSIAVDIIDVDTVGKIQKIRRVIIHDTTEVKQYGQSTDTQLRKVSKEKRQQIQSNGIFIRIAIFTGLCLLIFVFLFIVRRL